MCVKKRCFRLFGPFVAVVAAAVLLSAGTAPAAMITVYQDDFDGGSGNLHGRTPNVVSGDFGTAGATWDASTYFKSDGTLSYNNNSRSAYLPFVPEPGWIYTLEVDLSVPVPADSGRWLSLGFSKDSNVGAGPNNSGGGGPGHAWMLVRRNGDGAAFLGPATSNPIAPIDSASLGVDVHSVNTYKIVLDMMGGVDDADLAFYVNNDSWASEQNVDLTGLQYVQLGRHNTSGQYYSLTLTAVPEPGAWLLLLIAAACGLLVRRRK